MMQSSIRFSFVGEHVGWTTKMSRARTFCSISTSTSPSEKRPTLALPRLIDRCVAMSCASDRLALPENRTVLKSMAFASANLAGEEGLEPSNVGIKIRCLNQLGDSPTQAAGSHLPPSTNARLAAPGPAGERMARQRAAHPARPARRPIARHRCRGRRAASRAREDGASRTCHPAVAEGSLQRRRRAPDIGTKTLGGCLQVVPPEALDESRPGFPRPARLGIDTGSGLGKTRN